VGIITWSRAASSIFQAPVYHSTDLVNWRQVGHCLTRKSQLNLEKSPPSGGIFAPTIRYHQGTFYMITTNVTGGGNFYVTANDPAGEWSEAVFVDPGMFDPSLFFDDDGKVYYTRRGERGIVQAEIDLTNGQWTTPLRMVVEKYISPDIEGPHLYKIDGWYYLMAAEGGSRFGHGEVIGRSHSPWGPFEACPHNPILTHRDQGHGNIRDTGHAELVQDSGGHWWLFCLGTRQLRYDSATMLGRETFLAPVEWTADGWPVVGEGGTIPETFKTDFLPAQEPFVRLWRDDFDRAELDFCWNFLRNPYEADWNLRERAGYLRLRGSPVTLSDWDAPAFVGRRQEDFRMRTTCMLDFMPSAENEEAGLSVYE
jgi:alpha-N-arabinofuranosidase